MKIAYLVLAHNNPGVLKRSIKALSSEACAFFIHIDRKSDIGQFSDIQGENVTFIESRVPVFWGEFSMVQATLLLLRAALDCPANPDYCVLMSGCDYPLRSSEYICSFLEENRGSEFMKVVKVPAPGKPLARITTLRFPSDKPVRRFAARALARLGLAQRNYRKYLGSLKPYSGSQWWALTSDACRYVLQFVDQNQQFVEYFKNVFAPDESFFQTIVANSPFGSRVRGNLVYEDWSAEGAHPATIGDRHTAFLEERDKKMVNDVVGEEVYLFARKFSDDNLAVVCQIDEMIRRKEGCLTPAGE